MQDDTKIGGASPRFPATRWSVLLASRSQDAAERTRAFEAIVAAYWKPVYKYIRVRWNKTNEDAKDLTQEFFARLIEKSFLDSFDPAKARLRTFLRACVDGFLSNQEKAAHRLKRGGDAPMLSLDFAAAEGELERSGRSPLPPAASPAMQDEYFQQEWIRHLFSLSVDALRDELAARGKATHFRLFERYDLEEENSTRPTYQQLAQEFGIAASDVTNHLAYARRVFRAIVLEKLRTITASDDEFRREARAVLGVEPE